MMLLARHRTAASPKRPVCSGQSGFVATPTTFRPLGFSKHPQSWSNPWLSQQSLSFATFSRSPKPRFNTSDAKSPRSTPNFKRSPRPERSGFDQGPPRAGRVSEPPKKVPTYIKRRGKDSNGPVEFKFGFNDTDGIKLSRGGRSSVPPTAAETRRRAERAVKRLGVPELREKTTFTSETANIFSDKQTFADLGLTQTMLAALQEMYLAVPTQIQALVIPRLMKGDGEYVISDQTGTGKTLAYLIPIIHALKKDELTNGVVSEPNRPRALIMVPSRELAKQIEAVAKKISHHVKLRVEAFTGGYKFKPQKEALKTGEIEGSRAIDLLITTPGRLLNHRERDRLFFSKLKHVVIDEADTMFDKDFKEDMDKVVGPLKNRESMKQELTQFVFVSATLSAKLLGLIKTDFPNCEALVTPSIHKVRGNVKQEFLHTTNNKLDVLVEILQKAPPKQRIMVFCNTVDSCRAMDHALREKGFKISCFHGDMPHLERIESFRDFNSKKTNIMVCTDAASRGIDAVEVEHVILFDFPLNVIDYLHRVGRTARAAGRGRVTAFVKKGDRVLADRIRMAIKENKSLEGISPKLDEKPAKQQKAKRE